MSEFSEKSHYNGENHALPTNLHSFFINRVFEITGVLILIAVGFTIIAIATWSPTDPSLNYATSSIAQNKMGLAGAYLSDFLIQTFGIAVIFLLIPLVIMGWDFTRHNIIKRPVLRTLAGVFAGFFLAGTLSALPTFDGWPLKTGFGGISGKVTLSITADLFGSSAHLVARSIAAILLAITGVALGLYACGLRFKETISALTFINEDNITSGAELARKAKNNSSLLGKKLLKTAAYIGNFKHRNKDPFNPHKKPWKTADNHAPLNYENLSENNMKNTPKFLSKNTDRNKSYNPLKAKTGLFINKVMSGIGRKNQEETHHVEPKFNPHAFEPIGHNQPHIPNLEQEVQAHYQAEQPPQNNIYNEVVGSAEMGDFYDGPNSYEDYWLDSSIVNAPEPEAYIEPNYNNFSAPVDDHPFAPSQQPSFAHPATQFAAQTNAPEQHFHYAPVTTPESAPIIESMPVPVPVPVPVAALEQPRVVADEPTQPFDLSAPKVNVRKGHTTPSDPNLFNGTYELPSTELLAMPQHDDNNSTISEKILAANARILENVLAEFKISGEIMNVRPGPVVTLYELEPAPGVKSARVIGLADDIARSMSAISARIAVIPGRNVIGIELPNDRRDMVYLNEIISAPDFNNDKYKLPMALGKSIDGTPVITDLARMPHLLIAGTTGSGKSVGINAMILSILYKHSPDKCKLIMVDPKMLELSIYDGIPHLLTPVVTDPKKAVVALKWSVREMENRYKKMSKMGVRNIEGYNQRIKAAQEKGEPLMRTMQTGFDHETGKPVYEHEELNYKEMPFIVIVIDEMADLMMVAGKEIENAVQRLAQMARAAGIHIITATQRPSVDVITGSIKANFPTRISFQVTSKIDSRTILNEMGAEQLLGQGDMLHMSGGGRIARVHGAFVSDEEVESIVNHLKRQGVPEYIDDVTADLEEDNEAGAESNAPIPTTDSSGAELDLYDQAVAIVARDKKASTSYIQRRLSIGYNRAATIIERMEDEGVISAANHAGKREILVNDTQEY